MNALVCNSFLICINYKLFKNKKLIINELSHRNGL